jgi:outer membrane protein TolC
MLALILSVVTATLPMLIAGPRDNVKPVNERINESTTKIKELQTERIAALKELVEISLKLYQNGRSSYEEALDAQGLLLQAELDGTEKESDRIALYKNYVEVMKGYEKIALAQKAAGRGATTAILKFRAKRLEAEIHLEQARAKEAKGSK